MTEAISHSLVKALRSVPDFATLDDHALLQIVGASVNLSWPPGATVFERGSVSEALYIVLSGEISISEPSADGEVEISRVGAGSSFGELSLLLHTTHTRDARAVEATELMVIPRDSFEDLLASNPELATSFRHRLEERLPVRGEVPQA
ncbi:MAG TPA: cyclic nucleotide-binding domain-containing protein [Actinomycetota bacterium]|nr:cyclic nucleotide-binding domain-containing protein [Actinomycetota bacterium]